MKTDETELQKRNSRVVEISKELKRLLPDVLAVTGIQNESSLHAKFGGKNDVFLDIKHEVIISPEHFISLWLQGFMKYLEKLGPAKKHSTHYQNFQLMKAHKVLRDYVLLFTGTYVSPQLRRTLESPPYPRRSHNLDWAREGLIRPPRHAHLQGR